MASPQDSGKEIKPSPKKKNNNYIILFIVIVLALILVIYIVVLYESWKHDKFVFKPYTPPNAPENTFYPLGNVTPATPEQLAERAALLKQLEEIS